ncbi:unnamed protein product, partial [marine sediment metagenome]
MDYRLEIRKILQGADVSVKDFCKGVGMSTTYVRHLLMPKSDKVVIWMR